MLHPSVFLLLVPDVLTDDRFVSPYGRDEVAARPEMLTHEVALPLAERPRDVDCALALDVPDDLRDRILRRDRDHHVHVVGHEVPFLDAALLLLRKRPEDRTEVPAQLSVEHLAPAFWDEDHVVFALPPGMVETLVVIHLESLSWSLSRSRRGSRLENPGNVKLGGSPGRAGGFPAD